MTFDDILELLTRWRLRRIVLDEIVRAGIKKKIPLLRHLNFMVPSFRYRYLKTFKRNVGRRITRLAVKDVLKKLLA